MSNLPKKKHYPQFVTILPLKGLLCQFILPKIIRNNTHLQQKKLSMGLTLILAPLLNNVKQTDNLVGEGFLQWKKSKGTKLQRRLQDFQFVFKFTVHQSYFHISCQPGRRKSSFSVNYVPGKSFPSGSIFPIHLLHSDHQPPKLHRQHA